MTPEFLVIAKTLVSTYDTIGCLFSHSTYDSIERGFIHEPELRGARHYLRFAIVAIWRLTNETDSGYYSRCRERRHSRAGTRGAPPMRIGSLTIVRNSQYVGVVQI